MLGQVARMARGLQSFRQLQRPVGDELVDIGILQDIGDFPQAELEIDRNRNGAERGNREIGADVLGPVAGKDAGAVAAAQSGGLQAAAAGSDAVAQVLIGKAARAVDDGNICRLAVFDEFMDEHS